MSTRLAPGPIGVVGAGLMGGGIAQITAAAGRDVVLYSRSAATVRRALDGIGASLRRRGADTDAVDRTLARISGSTDLAAMSPCVAVIESVAEDMALKQRVFADLDRICMADTLLATNTSGIPITRIAAATARPERVVGTHFFSPVPVMKLCEVVRGESTTDDAVAVTRQLLGEIGKECVVVDRDIPGFVTTRLMAVLILEAIRLVESGVCTPHDVDLACRLGFGHTMGPLATADLGGLDVLRDVVNELYRVHFNPVFAAPRMLDELVSAGRCGRKTGSGFYDYTGNTP